MPLVLHVAAFIPLHMTSSNTSDTERDDKRGVLDMADDHLLLRGVLTTEPPQVLNPTAAMQPHNRAIHT